MIWLTQQTFDRLHAELEDRRGPRRAEIVERISAARDEGDLKENGGYHAAKDEQGTNEARIRQLEEQLKDATTEPSADDQTSLRLPPPQPPSTQRRPLKTTAEWPLRPDHGAAAVTRVQCAPSAEDQTSFRS